MSNDRLWVHCRHCGEQCLLAKGWAVDWVPWDNLEPAGEFIAEHGTCGAQPFTFSYEQPPGVVHYLGEPPEVIHYLVENDK